jgi:hypothetical protein
MHLFTYVCIYVSTQDVCIQVFIYPRLALEVSVYSGSKYMGS